MAEPADLAIAPYSSPDTVRAIHHPRTVGRSRRTARPAGFPRRSVWGDDRERSGTRLDPRSRRPARTAAVTARATVRMAIGTKAHGLGPVSGAASSTQPRGDAQMRTCTPTPASATLRTAYDTPSTTAAQAAAWRRLGGGGAGRVVRRPYGRRRRRGRARPHLGVTPRLGRGGGAADGPQTVGLRADRHPHRRPGCDRGRPRRTARPRVQPRPGPLPVVTPHTPPREPRRPRRAPAPPDRPRVVDRPHRVRACLLYTSPSPRDRTRSRM